MKNQYLKWLTILVVPQFFLLIGILLITNPIDKKLGYSVNTGYLTSLEKSITATDTEIVVDSSKLINNEELTFSAPFYLDVDMYGSSREIVECWTFASSTTNATFSNCNRGLSFSGNSSTSTITANRKPHSGGAPVKQSDVHYVFEQLVDRSAAELVAGLKTFTNTTTTFLGSIALDNSAAVYLKKSGNDIIWSIDGGLNTYTLATSTIANLTASSTRGLSSSNGQLGIDTTSLTNNYISLGRFGNAFRDLYASGTIRLSGSTTIYGDFVSNLLPTANNTYNLGAFRQAWGNIFASGTLYGNSLVISATSTSPLFSNKNTHSSGGSSGSPLWATTSVWSAQVSAGNLNPNSIVEIFAVGTTTPTAGVKTAICVSWGSCTVGNVVYQKEFLGESTNWLLNSKIANRNSFSDQIIFNQFLSSVNSFGSATETITFSSSTINTANTQSLQIDTASNYIGTFIGLEMANIKISGQ